MEAIWKLNHMIETGKFELNGIHCQVFWFKLRL